MMPDDPFIVDMDPVQKMYLFYHWLEDEVEKAEFAKNNAYLIGGFSNPEMLKKLLDEDKVIATSDEDFERSLRMVRESAAQEDETASKSRRRKRRKK